MPGHLIQVIDDNWQTIVNDNYFMRCKLGNNKNFFQIGQDFTQKTIRYKGKGVEFLS